MLAKKIVRRIAFARVLILAFAAFIFNTTEFIPVALLSDIGAGFAMSAEETGIMITVYAWVVFLMSLPVMLFTAKLERRSLLIKMFILFIGCHILSVVAWNYWVLLLSRVGVAIGQALFWAITASLVVRVAPKDKKAQALALLAVGTSLAMVLGLPLGRLVGQWLGWRATFGLIALVALVVMILMMRWLPKLPSKNAGSLASLPILLKRPLLMGAYFLTILVISAHFTAYSYIEPFSLKISQFSPAMATALLLVFGLSGIVASLLFNKFHRHGPTKFLLVAIGILAGSLLLLLPLSSQQWAMYLLVFVWGIGISAVGLSLQVRILQLAPDATDLAMALYSGIYNIGIGGGALLGKIVAEHLGLSQIGWIGASLAIFGAIFFVLLHLKYRQKSIYH